MPSLRRTHGSAKPTRLVVVGNGMASLSFCEEAVALKLNQRSKITVVGGEAYPAYDRVRLSQYVKSRDATSLVLRNTEWYAQHGIELHLADPVTHIDTALRTLRTKAGTTIEYDRLVLATGSSPFVPPIPGTDLPGVHVYRNLKDLDGLTAEAATAKTAMVMGGGLLGLEAAQALGYLGLRSTIVERAEFPMPRQLQSVAGPMIAAELQAMGIAFVGNFSAAAIHRHDSSLELHADDDRTVTADLLVISAGITPNSTLAADAGLRCGVRGGVIVDDQLRTSDPNIFAIGECALHRGQIYGLAAPAAAMARHVAQHLAGKKPPAFDVPDLSTRLKMLGLDVLTIGNPLDRGEVIEYQSGKHYRMITLTPNRTLAGALVIGGWPEANLLHEWFVEGRALRQREIQRFVTNGSLSTSAVSARVIDWPDERLVCNCSQVSKGTLCHAMAAGACTLPELARTTGASTVCGSCLPLLEQLCQLPPSQRRGRAPGALIALAVAALIATIAVLVIRVPTAQSVASSLYQLEQWWSNPLPKQVTGYSLLGIVAIGLLISLRKRLPRLQFGAFTKWRVFHAAFGLLALAMLFAHTGFRFGSNLNACLMSCFVGLNLLGALAGMAAGLETVGSPRVATTARALRPTLTIAHYVLFWPLPVLLAFHIACAYLY